MGVGLSNEIMEIVGANEILSFMLADKCSKLVWLSFNDLLGIILLSILTGRHVKCFLIVYHFVEHGYFVIWWFNLVFQTNIWLINYKIWNVYCYISPRSIRANQIELILPLIWLDWRQLISKPDNLMWWHQNFAQHLFFALIANWNNLRLGNLWQKFA